MSLAIRPLVTTSGSELIRAHEARLYQTLLAIYGLGGFTAVHAAVRRQERRLGKELQIQIACEGWIA